MAAPALHRHKKTKNHFHVFRSAVTFLDQLRGCSRCGGRRRRRRRQPRRETPEVIDGPLVTRVVIEVQGVTERVVMEVGGVAAAVAADLGDEVAALLLHQVREIGGSGAGLALKRGTPNDPRLHAVVREATR